MQQVSERAREGASDEESELQQTVGRSVMVLCVGRKRKVHR
jgi:hypothetical protein